MFGSVMGSNYEFEEPLSYDFSHLRNYSVPERGKRTSPMSHQAGGKPMRIETNAGDKATAHDAGRFVLVLRFTWS